jgi:amino acid adenylation domain-containing protein
MKIERTGNQDVFATPVSYSQERLWFLEQLEPGTPLYNIPYVATMKGAVHRAAFNRAVNRLVARHESLRTCFIESAGGPRQAIYAGLSVEVDWHDLGHLDPRACAEKTQAICRAAAGAPFDLGKAPLFRIALVASAAETTVITTIHHIIADGWSLAIFQRELSALYQEELGGRPAALPELRVQYADYAAWQRERLQGEGIERLKQYWARQLDGATTVLELPGDYQRPLKQTFHGDVYTFEIGPELTMALGALSARREATLFMTLFSAFAVLLYRLTGHQDLLVGTPVAGRKGAEVEGIIGFFVNTLVLRARLEPEWPFTRLLANIKAMTLDAFEHQDMPFEKLVLELNPKRDLSHGPLIQVLFALQNIPPLQALMAEGAGAPPASARGPDGHTGTAKFDFALFASEVRDRLECSIEYNTDLFSPATIKAAGDRFVTLLNAIVKAPEAKVSSYPLMAPAERQQCLSRGRGADRGYAEGAGCHQLFERQCRATPRAVALAHGLGEATARMTYAELNARANRIARRLVARGVRRGDSVGLCVPRGFDQIAALLAIVKAGAAYVPLDPDYPADRLNYIVGDVGARLVVLGGGSRVSLGASVDTMVLEHEAEPIGELGSDDLGLEHSPEAPLYVLHTSGSTGRPKGVVMPHRSIVNLAEWQARASNAPAGTVTLQYASLNFDVASQEIFATLTSGGCLLLVDEGVRRDGPRLLGYLKSQRVGRLFLPPVALEQLANAAAGNNASLPDLREVIVAGDKLHVTDGVRDFFEQSPRARLVNQYGPTETHVVAAHVLTGPPSKWPTHPPIGAPIDNVQLYILDENLEPVPAKVAGELYVGGAAVALGYLNLREETSERFVRDPFQYGDGLLYRTGDLCRHDGDATLTFVGRADQQIKLRGFRIEPGEIEVVLKQHAGINDAVVVKRPSKRGDDELAAYLAVEADVAIDRAELRAYLADKLPAYMIPTHFVRLDSLPLTDSGKVDRRRLPEPAETASARDEGPGYVAPRTPVERFLADCWRDVLQIEKVSAHDNFFDLGGHSLSATQIVSRVRDQFGLELPLYRVFERPTLELLALEIIQKRAAKEEQSQLEAMLSELESLSDEDSEARLCAGQ